MSTDVDTFIRDGMTILRGVFSDAEVAELRTAFTRVADKVTRDPERYESRYTLRENGEADTWGVNHIFAPDLYEPALAGILDKPAILEFARAVLGERLRFWGGHALWAPQRTDYRLNWHRDFGDDDVYIKPGEDTHIQFNVCLMPDDCFQAIPGSHLRPLTAEESRQQRTKGIAELPGQVVARCLPGDVLFMNAHTLHRGSCESGTQRQTVHISLQPYDEPTGGHTSWRFMRNEGYLDGLSPTVRELMQNAVDWDDSHPLSLAETRKRLRTSRNIKRHQANGSTAADSEG